MDPLQDGRMGETSLYDDVMDYLAGTSRSVGCLLDVLYTALQSSLGGNCLKLE
jgi:hypothetical protein